ncbi:MAG: carboxypeptidase-like regulatory domain-containing protein, partial [Chitinophagaceae bacterium]|nr:carboxypeptidase-like regulatory domain-containing protein [Chitinophagaceae bacterium]
MRFIIAIASFLIASIQLSAQKKTTVKGKVLDENNKPIAGVSIQIIGKQKGTVTNDTGFFQINIAPNKIAALEFTSINYIRFQKNLTLNEGEIENITIKLKRDTSQLKGVTVKNNKDRRDPGRIYIDPSKAGVNPSPIQGIEQLIKIFVGSNNELTSQYAVRGGSYDENLIYV